MTLNWRKGHAFWAVQLREKTEQSVHTHQEKYRI